MSDQEDTRNSNPSQAIIHRAPWIVTGVPAEFRTSSAHGVIEDGALVVAGGLIRAVGTYGAIAREFGGQPLLEHEDSVLAPALINSHCHLELSGLDLANRPGSRKTYNGDLPAWIRDLLAAREEFSRSQPDAEERTIRPARKDLQAMASAGVAFIGDVGNSLGSRTIGNTRRTRVCFLLELLGLTRDSEKKAFARLEQVAAGSSPLVACTPHAPYSTTPALLQTLKMMAERKGQVYSIHVAESSHEVEFLQSGTGLFRDFLLARGVWDGSFTVPEKSPVHYLESLGVITDKTLCVHAVHVESSEIEILARRKAKVCLCPGSNRFLGVGKAPVTEFLTRGILPALGTDSLASNELLNMWREMRLLREDHPTLSPQTVFAMATRGGAEAWGIDSAMGTLEPGKRAAVLSIRSGDRMCAAGEVLEYLTTAGETVQTAWLEQKRTC